MQNFDASHANFRPSLSPLRQVAEANLQKTIPLQPAQNDEKSKSKWLKENLK
jgi:hypothetical protein